MTSVPDYAAAGGLLASSSDRRTFLTAAAAAGSSLLLQPVAASEVPDGWTVPGGSFTNYGLPPDDVTHPIRWIANQPSAPGDGVSWTPLHQLQGMITPNGLHFERHHNGIPSVDVDSWELVVDGLVKQPKAFSLDVLHRYPMHTRIAFIECGGNSNALWRQQPVQTAAGYLHGLVSCSEWTGVRLSDVIDDCGLQSSAKWLVADGFDSSGVTVSLPLDKVLDDVMIALYQNGEPVRPSQGYPARLLVPGWEGIVNLKWLQRLTLTDRPAMTKFDTVSYTDLQTDGTAERFSFEMGVKSLITHPSPGHQLPDKGYYQIRGLAWSGAAPITKVEVSADGGRSWALAQLREPVIDKALTGFSIDWQWQGGDAVLLSRAVDGSGNIQPMRDSLISEKGLNSYYHYNAVTAWSVDSSGALRHVYI